MFWASAQGPLNQSSADQAEPAASPLACEPAAAISAALAATSGSIRSSRAMRSASGTAVQEAACLRRSPTMRSSDL
jgi:hypothetical protein